MRLHQAVYLRLRGVCRRPKKSCLRGAIQWDKRPARKGTAMSDTQEIVQRLEREMADRAAAVEKVDAFKNQLAQAIKAFMAADEAVRGLNDHDSIVDAQIATVIDEHLRAIDRLCRFGIDGGFGEEHPVKEY